jgi:hypothetical protein
VSTKPCPVKSSSKKVATKSFILQENAEPHSSVPVWAERSQLLLGMWPWASSESSPHSEKPFLSQAI